MGLSPPVHLCAIHHCACVCFGIHIHLYPRRKLTRAHTVQGHLGEVDGPVLLHKKLASGSFGIRLAQCGVPIWRVWSEL